MSTKPNNDNGTIAIGEQLCDELLDTEEKIDMFVELNHAIFDNIDTWYGEPLHYALLHVIAYVSTRSFVLSRINFAGLSSLWKSYLDNTSKKQSKKESKKRSKKGSKKQSKKALKASKASDDLLKMNWRCRAIVLFALLEYSNVIIVDAAYEHSKCHDLVIDIINHFASDITPTNNFIMVSLIVYYLTGYATMISYTDEYSAIETKIRSCSEMSVSFERNEFVSQQDFDALPNLMNIVTQEICDQYNKCGKLRIVNNKTGLIEEIQMESLPTEQEVKLYTEMGMTMRNDTVKIITDAMIECCSGNVTLIKYNCCKRKLSFDSATKEFERILDPSRSDEDGISIVAVDLEAFYGITNSQNETSNDDCRFLNINGKKFVTFKNVADQQKCIKELSESFTNTLENVIDKPSDMYAVWLQQTLIKMILRFENIVNRYV